MKKISFPSLFSLGLACGCLCGLLSGRYCAVPAVIFGFFLSSFLLVLYEKNHSIEALVFALSFMSGIGTQIRSSAAEASLYWGLEPKSIVEVSGFLSRDPSRKGSRMSFVLEADEVRDRHDAVSSARQRVWIDYPGQAEVYRGDRISLRCRIHDRSNGVWFASGEINSCVILNTRSRIRGLRIRLFELLKKNLQTGSRSSTGFLQALILGVRDRLVPGLEDAFLRAGVIHILALSGMHVGILVLLVVSLSRPVFGRRVSGILSAVFVLVYLFLVGARASIVRAVIMYLLYFFTRSFGRKVPALSILALTFSCALLVSPSSLYDAGFTLSYLAMTGILALTPRIRLTLRPYLPEPALTPFSLSLGAQIAALPAMAVFFGAAYPAGLFASLLLSPLVVLFIWIGAAACVLRCVLPAGNLLVRGFHSLVDFLYTLTEMTVHFFSNCPACEITLDPCVLFVCLGFSAAFIRLCGRLRERSLYR